MLKLFYRKNKGYDRDMPFFQDFKVPRRDGDRDFRPSRPRRDGDVEK